MRPLTICLLALLWPATVHGEAESAVIHSIVLTELISMKMPINSAFCLAMLPATDINSDEGTDPPPGLLALLVRKGMRPQKVSTCDKAHKGNVISIEMVEKDGGLAAKVSFVDITLYPGLHVGTLWHRGVYQLRKSSRGNWVIESYICEFNEPPLR